MKLLQAIAVTAITLAGFSPTYGSAAGTAKNWTPPPYKIYAQVLADRTMATHPELLSVTFHGVPPGSPTDTWTMYAGSYPDRVGNPDDPDDIDVSKKGITILDPRWHRTKDPVKKFVVLEPLRDKAGENIGLIVYAFKTDSGNAGERKYALAAMDLRDALQAEIPSYATLFEKAK